MEEVKNATKKEQMTFVRCYRCEKVIKSREGIGVLCWEIIGNRGNRFLFKPKTLRNCAFPLCWECYYEFENYFLREVVKPYNEPLTELKHREAKKFLKDKLFLMLKTDKDKFDYLRIIFNKREWHNREVKEILQLTKDLKEIDKIKGKHIAKRRAVI
jgi:hypothetical protein